MGVWDRIESAPYNANLHGAARTTTSKIQKEWMEYFKIFIHPCYKICVFRSTFVLRSKARTVCK